MASTWKEEKIEYMRFLYGNNIPKYEEEMKNTEYKDDRQVYINIYRMIMEMLDTMPEEPNLYVKVAIGDKMREDTDMMQRINIHFTGKKY